MKIVCIFDNSLYSFKYENESIDEFERLFDLWNDTEYLEEFFEKNKSDLQSGFWGAISVEEAILKTIKDANYFEKRLIELAEKDPNDQTFGLECLFRPLHDSQIPIYELNYSKASRSWLRIYALRADKSAFIITGGAIKLTKTMAERNHTNIELDKLRKCRDYLIEKGIIDINGIIEELEL